MCASTCEFDHACIRFASLENRLFVSSQSQQLGDLYVDIGTVVLVLRIILVCRGTSTLG